MTYDEIENGLKSKDPNAVTFVGFWVGLLSLLSGIGSMLVHFNNKDGWFMIGFSLFFFMLFILSVFQTERVVEKVKTIFKILLI